jgi:trehalose/maltose hydrolase-like predicted phosphorylase
MDTLERRPEASGSAGPQPDGHDADSGWTVTFRGADPVHEPSRAAQTSLGDGVIGTAGSPPVRMPGGRYEVIVGDVYVGAGAETDMLRVPTWTLLDGEPAADPELERVLDMRTGTLHRRMRTVRGPVEVTTYSMLADPGIVGLRASGAGMPGPSASPLDTAAAPPAPSPSPSFLGADAAADHGCQVAVIPARPGGVAIAARDRVRTGPDGGTVLDRIGAYVADPGRRPPTSVAVRRLQRAEATGLDRLVERSRAAWARRWAAADIGIAGDVELQRAVRFSLFHLMGSVPDRGEAAVGARGLTGPAYRGHVFWDADVFTLPFFAATHPGSARAMLEYRVRRLAAARANAVAEGYQGAWFPWESARDGRDVTPRWGTPPGGEPVRIWSGDHELHITSDVAWAAATYVEWTADRAFADGPARRLYAETARYWASRVEMDAAGRGHISGVVGPDEYHEIIDDNAYTNQMASWNLRHAALHTAGEPGVTDEERAGWESLAAAIVDGYDPARGRHVQYAGFDELEPVLIRDLLSRPVAADKVLGREKVQASQIIKQADVLMLHLMIPDLMPAGSLLRDLEYFEPRTAHGSSLSPGVHAAMFARAGRLDEAVAALTMTARMDLDELLVSASLGLHTAAMGGLWLALVAGFGGIRPAGDALRVDPKVPDTWGRFSVPVTFRGSRVTVVVDGDRLDVRARPDVSVRVGDGPVVTAGPRGARFRRSSAGWEPR